MFSRPHGPLAPFAFPRYRRIWFASIVFSLGNWGERLAVGWLVLSETNSVFLTAATFAARQAPQMIAAPIGGAVADRFSRGKILLFAGVYKTFVLLLIALVAANGLEPLWLIFVLLGFSGVGVSFELPAIQGMVTGSVPRQFRMISVTVQSAGARLVGALGALASGFAIDALGVPVTLIASGFVFATGGVLALIADIGSKGRNKFKVGANQRTGSVFRDVVDGLKLILRLPVVRMVLITAVFVEIFGFAFGSVMPAVAKDALGVDAKGLGTLMLMAGVGSVIGSIALVLLGNYSKKGLLLIIVIIVYGLFIGTFTISGSYTVALILIMGVGAFAAMFDAIQWTLLQLNVPDEMRGRAIGAWVFAIGFGWIGHLGLGALGELFGVQWALAGAGAMVVVVGLAALLLSPGLRRA
ncbi:MFS transporter [Dehalococcoides mccartyi]|nr:MFS transporter [Dehalococcoides mccartyi]